MSNSDIIRPISVVRASLGYQQSTSSTRYSYHVLNFTNPISSETRNEDGDISRSDTKKFTACVRGWFRGKYFQTSYPSYSWIAGRYAIFKNGQIVESSISQSSSRNASRYGSSSYGEVKLLMDVNDYLELKVAPQDWTNIHTMSFSNFLFEFIEYD